MSAQSPDTVLLPPVVVTATRLPATPSSLSAAVSVLPGAWLRAVGLWSVADALREVPGAAVVQSGSFGAQTSLFLRGGESDYTKVLINGVPVNLPGGAFDFAGLTTDNVERIEVLRGPASVLYGSDAVTGVVQILTRDRRLPGQPVATVGLRGGSYASVESYASLAGGSETVGWSVGGRRAVTDGTLPFNNRSRTGVLDARAHVAPDAKSDIAVSVRWEDHLFHFPTDGAGNLTDRNQSTTERGPTVGVEAGRFFTPRLEGRLLISSHRGELRYDDPQDGPGDTLGFYTDYHSRDQIDRRDADARLNLHFGTGLVVTGGAALEYEHDRSTNICTGAFGDCSSPAIDTSRTTRSLYAQAVAPLGARVDAVAGARLDHSRRFGDVATYRAGVAWRPGVSTRARVTFGTGFKEPTFLENFSTGFVRGNPDLEGERTTSGEVGLEQTLWAGHVTVGAAVFVQRFRNLIDYLSVPPSLTDPNYFNVAAAMANGIETEFALRPSSAVAVTGSYTFLHTRVTRSGFDSSTGALFAAGLPLIRRPAHSARLDVRWHPAGGATLSIATSYVGQRDDQDYATFPAPRAPLPSYTRVDLAGRVDVGRGGRAATGVAVTIRVQNALNAFYEEVRHFPAPRRTFLVGAELAVGR